MQILFWLIDLFFKSNPGKFLTDWFDWSFQIGLQKIERLKKIQIEAKNKCSIEIQKWNSKISEKVNIN